MTDTSTAADQAEKTGGRRALGTMLVEKGLLEGGQLDEALRIGDENGERLGEVVVRLGWVSEEDLAKVLAEQWHLRYLDRSGISFDADALRRLSREEATRLEALPMHVDRDGLLAVALAEPTEARLLALRDLLGDRIQPVVVPKTALDLGLRGSLLASRGNGGDETLEVVDEVVEPAAETEPEPEPESPVVPPAPPVASTPVIEPRDLTTEFDVAAKSIVDDLTSRLDALRGVVDESLQAVVDEAQEVHDRDRGEIARLEGVLAERDETNQQRDQTIREMKNALRTLADNL
jgi:hypothetical protein